MIPSPTFSHRRVRACLAGAACLWLLPLAASAQTPSPVAGTNPAAVATPHDQPNKYWLEHFQHSLDRSKRGNVNLIFDGDSITDFWMGEGKEVWAKNYGRLNAVDYGISGDRTENMLWRVEKGQSASLHPKLVAILIGTNNTDHCTDAEVAGGVTAVVRAYQKACPSAVILLQAIFPRAESPTDPARQEITRVNQILAKLGDGKQVLYVDFGDKFLLPDGTINREFMPDTLHPSAKGYEVWAEAIRPIMTKFFGPLASGR